MVQHLQKIDFLRGIAILLVFSYHALLVIFGESRVFDFAPYGLWLNFSSYSTSRLLLDMTPAGMGAQGVTLFLTISGFLIHLSYLKSGGILQWSRFFNKRFWRIYPPYLAALLFFCLTVGTDGRLSFLTHLTLTHNFHYRTFFSINPSFWSLALEVQLYLLYPLFLLLRSWLGIGKLTVLAGVLTVLAITAGAVVMGTYTLVQMQYFPIWLSPVYMWLVWILGAYAGEMYFTGKRLFTASPYYLVAIYAGLVLSTLTIAYGLFGRLYFSLFFIYVIDWYLHRAPAPTSKLVAALSKFVALVGICSYSIYLIHQPFLKEIIGFFSFHQTNRLILGVAVVPAFGLIFGLGWLSYQFLEKPSIAWGSRFYRRFWQPAQVAGQTVGLVSKEQ
jgi:peptidoglycan/LPS O-acetylase OafA/YrhL